MVKKRKKRKTCVCIAGTEYIAEHREKNDATSIPPKLTTDFMLIMLFPLAVSIALQLKHVRACLAEIFGVKRKRLFREPTSSKKNASAISEKKFCFSLLCHKYVISGADLNQIRYSLSFCCDWIHFNCIYSLINFLLNDFTFFLARARCVPNDF